MANDLAVATMVMAAAVAATVSMSLDITLVMNVAMVVVVALTMTMANRWPLPCGGARRLVQAAQDKGDAYLTARGIKCQWRSGRRPDRKCTGVLSFSR